MTNHITQKYFAEMAEKASRKGRRRKAKPPKDTAATLQSVASYLQGCSTPVRYLCGIDPGAQTGLSVYNVVHRHWVSVETVNFHQVMIFADSIHEADKALYLFIVENASSLPIYRKKYGAKGEGEGQAQARNIGANNREAELLRGELARRGFMVLEYVPRSTWQNPIHKWTQAECREITGYEKQTNQHERDAIRFVWEHKHLLEVKE